MNPTACRRGETLGNSPNLGTADNTMSSFNLHSDLLAQLYLQSVNNCDYHSQWAKIVLYTPRPSAAPLQVIKTKKVLNGGGLASNSSIRFFAAVEKIDFFHGCEKKLHGRPGFEARGGLGWRVYCRQYIIHALSARSVK